MCHLHLKLCTPSCAAVLDILPKLPRVLPLDVDGKPDEQGGGNAHAQVDGVKAGQRGLERGGEALHDVQRLLREVRAGSQPRRLPQLGGKERDKNVGEVVRKYTRARKLTPRMLNELIEKIEVFNAEKIDGVWEQRLRIHYNCVGTIEIPTVLPLPIPEVSVNTRKDVVVNYAPCELAV